MRWAFLCALLLFAGCVMPAPPRYVVFFKPQSAHLDEAGHRAIDAAATRANQFPDSKLTVTGYADPQGIPNDNKDLSSLRAQVVAEALMADGVQPRRIHQRSVGSVDFQLDSLESRRVEITLDGL